jgi:hypothetical protein
MRYRNILIFIALATSMLYCSSSGLPAVGPDEKATAGGYHRTELPPDTTRLWITPDSLIRETITERKPIST